MVSRLRQAYPKAKIIYITSEPFRPLLEQVKGVELVTLAKPRSIKEFLSLKKQLSPYSFDILLCTQLSLRANLIYPFIKAKRKIGFDKARSLDGHSFFISESIPARQEHMLEAFLGFTDYLGVKSKELDYGYKEIGAPTSELPEKYILLHPCGSSKVRTWSQQRYSQLIETLSEKYEGQIVLTGTPADADYVNGIVQTEKVINLVGKSDLKELMAVMKEADCVIAPDSGPSHLASSLGVPVVGLYASLPPSFTGPYENQNNCVNAYEKALAKYASSVKKNQFPPQRIHQQGVMDLISVDEVVEKVFKSLK